MHAGRGRLDVAGRRRPQRVQELRLLRRRREARHRVLDDGQHRLRRVPKRQVERRLPHGHKLQVGRRLRREPGQDRVRGVRRGHGRDRVVPELRSRQVPERGRQDRVRELQRGEVPGRRGRHGLQGLPGRMGVRVGGQRRVRAVQLRLDLHGPVWEGRVQVVHNVRRRRPADECVLDHGQRRLRRLRQRALPGRVVARQRQLQGVPGGVGAGVLGAIELRRVFRGCHLAG